uniref:Translation initiation factor 2, beta subunit n=1 Tax=Marseillevirus LCMAC103 TaxID=2506604 RepID=A0A481YTM6_9VIRU|nr:MAG: translation initiation factor 2, beta subunit [Marseillevirus LCMAC103]
MTTHEHSEMSLDEVGAVETPDDKKELEEELAAFSLALRGAKKKKRRAPTVDANPQALRANDAGLYAYDDPERRLRSLIRKNNPGLDTKRTYTLAPPKVGFVGSKKTQWTNFDSTCQRLRRSPAHVKTFFEVELGAPATIDAAGRLTIQGRHRQAHTHIQAILKKYIAAYVRCAMCATPETELVRDTNTRLVFVVCANCGSQRAAAPIKVLYRATTRADRRAQRSQ